MNKGGNRESGDARGKIGNIWNRDRDMGEEGMKTDMFTLTSWISVPCPTEN